MTVKLTPDEYNFLCTNLQLDSTIFESLRQCTRLDKVCILEVDENQADTIRDFCGEKLIEIGFDENYSPNQAGLILESLIDKFFVG